jgi:hypothetical protein
VTRVYVDAGASALDGEAGASDPDGLRALRYLIELGHSVTIVGDDPTALAPELRRLGSAVVATVPARPEGSAWYVTTDVDRCRGMSARIRTVLVGAAPAPGSVRRCDTVARDLQAAVMEILAAEAMQPSAGATL